MTTYFFFRELAKFDSLLINHESYMFVFILSNYSEEYIQEKFDLYYEL